MKKEHMNRKRSKGLYSVAPGVWRIRDLFVNMYLIHNNADKKWVLLDAGLKNSAARIRKAAEDLFWPEASPSAIILSHAHFDHIGSLKILADEWDVPIYAHSMEKPYLTGVSSYPPPDPSAGGGLLSLLSFTFPKGPIDISERLVTLPEDGSIPVLPGWKYYHTPGHAPGHISLFRKSDRLLLAGDAVVTTQQESAFDVMLQKTELHGPPKYFTYNWGSAERSVKLLAGLEPSILATGHGKPMSGEEMRYKLSYLADNFNEATPSSGRYVREPALVNRNGVQYTPPHNLTKLLLAVGGITVAAVAGFIVGRRRHHIFS